ncbi:hypothetical protein CCACVL1_01918 [Corchorus capsularis]|uniref:Uncharacterized protein n=1 Tax=Corchorus capsularis TaxID=210143 RepID=A0A1R3KE79_COCAP|nr:hypothetical protein CCACVL1_01918 [Corchorus capsularis]
MVEEREFRARGRNGNYGDRAERA